MIIEKTTKRNLGRDSKYYFKKHLIGNGSCKLEVWNSRDGVIASKWFDDDNAKIKSFIEMVIDNHKTHKEEYYNVRLDQESEEPVPEEPTPTTTPRWYVGGSE